jgi:hypothetical protein
MNSITICLTNWRRPENLNKTIESIKSQSIDTNIYLWNNGDKFSHSAVDWMVESSANKICWPRWFMASMAETEFVCIMDDDLFLKDENILIELVELSATLNANTIIGPEGVNLEIGKTYLESKHIHSFHKPSDLNIKCDIIKGKFMLLRTTSIHQFIPLGLPANYREDDIAISGLFAQGKGRNHLCITSFGTRFGILAEPFALRNEFGHFDRRNNACKKYFPELI